MDGNNGSMNSPTADYAPDYIEEMFYRIPGRDSRRGEVTHKLWRDMNRQERRAVAASRNRVSRGRWP
jgi:hypothetical protein